MSDDTGIEWTHVPGYRGATWNPVRGCTKISPGCKHCYAETFAERWRGIAGHPYEQGFDLRLVPEKLDEPLRKRDPRAYFVNSMSDLFQTGVDFGFTAAVFGVMAATPRHIYMCLTKRAERQREFMLQWSNRNDALAACYLKTAVTMVSDDGFKAWQKTGGEPAVADVAWPLPNVWLGVSVEDRKYGLPRIDILRETPAAMRFLSVEPLLEDLGALDLRGIHWVIVGGESGANARPLDGAWVRSIRDQCADQGVAFFFKQWGGVMKKLHGRILDGRTHDAFPVRS